MSSYTPLDHKSRQIRLLRVLPKSPEQISELTFIHCELTVHTLDAKHPPPYTALSYVWGLEPPKGQQADSPTTTIIVNDERILARPNLLHALRSFQDRADEGHLWVDAVCINQGDWVEKEVQIALMGDIYSLAVRTIIWLGPADHDSDAGMDFIARVTAEDFEEEHFEQNAANLKAVMHIMQRSWWTRVWILQEAFLSKLPIARCGGREVPFESFVNLKLLHEDSYAKCPTMWQRHMIFQNVRFVTCLSNWEISRRELAEQGGASPFSWMSSTTSQLLSTVPHDKVFGVLGLCRPEDRAAIKADYSKPLRDVLIDVVLRSIHTEGFMFLSVVLPHDMKSPELKLPSWCPDLTALDLTQHLISVDYNAGLEPLDPAWAALGENSNLPQAKRTLVSSYDRNTELVVLYGCLCDTVTFADPMPAVPEYKGFDSDVSVQTKAQRAGLTIAKFKEWEALAVNEEGLPRNAYADTPGGRKEAFWRTIACDSRVSRGTRPLPPEFGERYEALLGRRPPAGCEEAAEEPLKNDWVRGYAVPAIAKCANKSFFVSSQGRMGMAIRGVREGDIVVVVKGATTPYVLRRRQDWGWTFVGEAYLHGVMDGEGVVNAVKEGWERMEFNVM